MKILLLGICKQPHRSINSIMNLASCALVALVLSTAVPAKTEIDLNVGGLVGNDVTCEPVYDGGLLGVYLGYSFGIGLKYIAKSRIGYSLAASYRTINKASFLSSLGKSQGGGGRFSIDYNFTFGSNPLHFLVVSLGPCFLYNRDIVDWEYDDALGCLFVPGCTTIAEVRAKDFVDELGIGLLPSISIHLGRCQIGGHFSLCYIAPIEVARRYYETQNATQQLLDSFGKPRAGVSISLEAFVGYEL
jgi:hypothetical protein